MVLFILKSEAMSINTKISFITTAIMVSIIMTMIIPTAVTFTLVTVISTGLIIYMIYAVLSDDYTPCNEGIQGPTPGYLNP